MGGLAALVADISAEARAIGLAVDREAYRRAGRDPALPIVCAGAAGARVCVVGRDLGQQEVAHGQPLVGAAGRALRRGVLRAVDEAPEGDALLDAALRHVLVCNLVPYKPPANRAYPARVRERLRPYLERLLACHFRGDVVITLGNEAFHWFAPYADAPLAARWRSHERYACDVPCLLVVRCGARTVRKRLTVCPLPHPSPANVRWKGEFASLLAARLARWL
jgi:uracil-DNA glycosylase family 4